MDKAIIDRLKHIETFYEQAPPGMVKEQVEQPEECIPDTEQNKAAREFLSKAPKKGLWMPLGKEVKVMQCWRCKNYGHRTGDRECPLFNSGNEALEKFREVFEDPMHEVMSTKKKKDQESKLNFLQQVLDQASTGESDDGSDLDNSKRKRKKRKNKKQQWVEKTSQQETDCTKQKKHKTKSKKHKSKHSEEVFSSKSNCTKPAKGMKHKRSHDPDSEEEEIHKHKKMHKHRR
uniref:Retinitis pigmentosa 9 protein homolog n=1 Tax=Phallusia mammillata TaxID=59560 RepID=A0A6F9DYH7_9ASCI|nr:retinitis pigmentosa 9 protein homolog [Phallusia mammillata]